MSVYDRPPADVDWKYVRDITEVTEIGAYYRLEKEREVRDFNWLQIDWQDMCEGTLEVNGNFGLHWFLTHGNFVRTWRTLNGVIRYLNEQSLKEHGEISADWADEEALEKAKEARTAEYQHMMEQYDQQHAAMVAAKTTSIETTREIVYLLEYYVGEHNTELTFAYPGEGNVIKLERDGIKLNLKIEVDLDELHIL